MLQWSRIILLVCVLVGCAQGLPQGPEPSGEVALTCECAQQIQSGALPGVFSATKDLSNVVDELFTLANRAEISPVTDRHICFFCGRIRRTYGHIHGGWHRRWRPRYYHHHHHGHHHWRRQVPQGAPPCPINDVRATENNAKEGAQVVREVLAGVKADPREISQDLLDEVTQLYNEVKESENSLKSVTNSINTECSSSQGGGGVAFPGQQG